MSLLIDTHNHLDYPDFDAARPALLAECARLGVVRQVLIGVERSQWPQLWRVATANAGLHAAPGLHPLYLQRHQEADHHRAQTHRNGPRAQLRNRVRARRNVVDNNPQQTQNP